MKQRPILFTFLWLIAASLAARAEAGCVLSKLAELPVTMSDLTPTVAAKVDGHAASLFIDSGAVYSILKPESAAKFGLKTRPAPPDFFVRGAAGGVNVSLATAKEFDFAGATYHRVEFMVLPIGHGAVDGLVGQNLLYAVDVEYDLGHGVIRLFQPSGCDETRLAYWITDQPYSVIHIDPASAGAGSATSNASLNGANLKVAFDTGAPRSYLTLAAAARAGIKPGDPGVTPVGETYGIGERRFLQTWLAPFDSFKLGDEEVRHTRLRLAKLELANQADMLIGADFFMSHRVFVSNSQHKLYFTYSGGPVFNLDATAPAAEAQAPAAK